LDPGAVPGASTTNRSVNLDRLVMGAK